MFTQTSNCFHTNTWLFLSILVLLLFAISLNYVRNRRYYMLMSKIPGPIARNPIVGNLNMVWYNSCNQMVNQLTQVFIGLSVIYKTKGIFKFKSGPLQVISIFRNDLVQDFLKNNTNLEKPFEYQILYDWLGKGLLINDNTPLWKHRRKLLTPAFHFKIIEDFLPVFNEKANILVENLRKYEKQSFDLVPLLFSCTLDAIAETTLGVEINSQQNQNLDYFEAVHRIGESFFYRLIRPWLFPDFFFYLTKTGKQYKNNLKILHGLTRRVINERKQKILKDKQNNISENTDQKKKRLAFLDLLLDIHLKDNSLSLEDIREEVDTFMFAGHDTSACCLTWTFYLLGLHPDIQHKLQDELETVLSKDEEITTKHIKQLPYLEAVIKECLRIYPPVPIISRKITEEFKVGEYVIPKGVSIYLLITSLHKDSNVFPEPFQFRPERFLADNQANSDSPFSFTPFSAGARSCIGQKFAINEIKIILAKILLNYSLESLEDRNDIIVFNGIVSKPLNGIQMRIRQK